MADDDWYRPTNRTSPKVASALLDEVVASYPEESELAQAQLQRAECLDSLDRPLEAVAAYRPCVAAQRAYPNALTVVPCEFAMFCIRRNLESLLDEALGYLDEFPDASMFPVDVFKTNSFRAIVAAGRGDATAARSFAAISSTSDELRPSTLRPGHPRKRCRASVTASYEISQWPTGHVRGRCLRIGPRRYSLLASA